jgi:hypothetical protein
LAERLDDLLEVRERVRLEAARAEASVKNKSMGVRRSSPRETETEKETHSLRSDVAAMLVGGGDLLSDI